MLSARNTIGKLKEEKRSELLAVNSGICYLCPLGKKNRLRPLWKKIFNEQCSTGHFSSL